MYIHDLDLAKAKREAPAYTFIVYFKTIHLEPLQKIHNPILRREEHMIFEGISNFRKKKKKEYKQSWDKKNLACRNSLLFTPTKQE